MTTIPKRPRETNQLANFSTDLATVEVEMPKTEGKDPAAVALGRKGGMKGGKARADKLSAKRRVEIAKMAAQARWKSKTKRDEDGREVGRAHQKRRTKISTPEG